MAKIDNFTHRYEQFRTDNRLRQSTWQETSNKGKQYACALGALLDVNDIEQAKTKGCAASVMPEWLIELTPTFFDHPYEGKPRFHIKWADALYLPGGLIDRANRLSAAKRKKLYEEAEKEVWRRLECQYGNPEYGETLAERYCNYLESVFNDEIGAEEVASTIIRALDDLLVQAGV